MIKCGLPQTVTVFRDLPEWDDDGTNMSEEWNATSYVTLGEVVKLLTLHKGVQATKLSVPSSNCVLWSQDIGFVVPITSTLYNVMQCIRNYDAAPSEQNGHYVFIAYFPPPSKEANA